MNKLSTFLLIISLSFLLGAISFFFWETQKPQTQKDPSSWHFTSVDTMKYSRDNARNPKTIADIPFYVKSIADLNASYVAIGTPYDEEFYPFLKLWVKEARKNNLKVWFRGNFSSWEQWFDYPAFADIKEHHTLTAKFIENHPDLFEDGDIFTPVPEAENGGPGDPRGNAGKTVEFNHFIVDSYDNCVASFKLIHKDVKCGYFSTNGDIAKDIITEETVSKTGNVIVIDHYVNSAQKMSDDIDYLTNKFPGAKIVLGEFGAPIEDINGNMTEQEQADFVEQVLSVLVEHKTQVIGVNYWLISGGKTAVYNQDKTPRLLAEVIKIYFKLINKN